MLIDIRSIALILLFSSVLYGCSSDKIVKTYPGKVLSEDVTAVLTAPENITLLSVNGVEVQQYLLSNLSVNYALKAGDNLIVFKYQSIWSKVKRDQETGARVDVVESAPLEVLIPAKPGEKYDFSFTQPSTFSEAKRLAENFTAHIVDRNHNVVTESLALNSHQRAKDALLKQQQAQLLEKSGASSSMEKTAGISVLERLKQLWPDASSDEKKEFLSWVFK